MILAAAKLGIGYLMGSVINDHLGIEFYQELVGPTRALQVNKLIK
jgi:hypothetical protein